MTLYELRLIFNRARVDGGDGIRAVVEALRDEMTLGWEDDRPFGDVADVKKFMNRILASDGEEAAGSASAHTEGGVHEFRTGIGGTEGGQEGGPRGMEREGNVAGASGPGREQQDDLAVHLHRVPSGASSVSAGQQGSVVGITDGRAGGRLGRGHGVSRDEAAGGSTREDGHDDAGIVLTSAPVTIKETIAGTVLRMEQGYTGGMNDICVPAPAERSDATAVCEWKRGKEDWLFIGCRPQFGLNPIFYKPEGACEFCSAPIKFTEAK